MPSSINVSNLGPSVTKEGLERIFSFNGKVRSIDFANEADGLRSATVTFENSKAARNATILNGTEVEGSILKIELSSDKDHPLSPDDGRTYDYEKDVPQEDKPRRRILAELLAHGYNISDNIINSAIELDKSNSISARFEVALNKLDSQFRAQERAQELDAKYDIVNRATKIANSWLSFFDHYVKSASNTKAGSKLRAFYQSAMHTVEDVHKEAQLIRGHFNTQTCNCKTVSDKCTCAPNTCACVGCDYNISTSCCKDQTASNCCKNKGGDCSSESGCKGQCEKSKSSGPACKCDKDAKTCVCKLGSCECTGGLEGTVNKSCGCDKTASACTCPKGACSCPKGSSKDTDCGCGKLAAMCDCPEGDCSCVGCSKNKSE